MSGLPQVCTERTPAHLLHGVHHLCHHREENQVGTFSSNPSPIFALPCLSLSSRDLTDVTLACEDHATSPKVSQPLLSLGKPLFEMRSVCVAIAQIAFDQTNDVLLQELSRIKDSMLWVPLCHWQCFQERFAHC